ncbi:DNA cytosine methyltransferase [uncultured Mitsuokella sp.]|uniref:DNA cytosine methyltransferase n=1 Tax=uncultured Mitsuokella sp. TaxID=453120 RepID=UPI0026273EA5|nr:DNA cytosine methyltransferase [uncultured Mitsuokella sp.]
MAACHAGVTPVWASEIEPFPCSVTARHFPDVKQLGDITQINPDEIEPVDIICAGSPCQDLSIAGKRKGLNGERSGLFRTAVDLVRRMRERTAGKYPRFFVWENVPGAFSSNQGMDFQAVLEEIGESEIPMPQGNRWAPAGLVQFPGVEIAWRVLDAQYWGVPQRRRRIFLVADFAADGRCAGEILFESEGVQGDTAKGEGERKGTAGGTAGCAQIAIYDMTHADEAMRPVKDGIVPTLNARMGTGGNQAPVAHSYCIAGNTIGRKLQNGGNGKGVLAETAYTLNTIDRHAVAEIYGMKSYSEYACHKVAALRASGGACGGGSENLALSASVVRRLTPTECERLQGLPDGYTEGGSDTARYKALGNGMAQPCATYIIKRIVEVVSNGRMENCSY